MSICDKRGHYFVPIDIPPVSNQFTWSILPPSPERKLYCRRCGTTKSLAIGTVHYTTTPYGTATIKTNYFSASWLFMTTPER